MKLFRVEPPSSLFSVCLLVTKCPGLCCCCIPTPMTLASGGGADVPACGPPASFSVHMASSAVTPAGSVHQSRGDNVVHMWEELKRWCVSVTEGVWW